MAEIKDETVYVIYRNGKPYEHVKKPVYLTKGAANGQITQVAEEIARRNFESSKYYDWYDLSKERRNEFIDIARKEFEVVPYGPNWPGH